MCNTCLRFIYNFPWSHTFAFTYAFIDCSNTAHSGLLSLDTSGFAIVVNATLRFFGLLGPSGCATFGSDESGVDCSSECFFSDGVAARVEDEGVGGRLLEVVFVDCKTVSPLGFGRTGCS